MNNFLDQRKLGIIIGIIVVVGVGIYFTQEVSEKKEQEGKSALYKIQKTYEDEVKALSDADKAPGASYDVDAKLSKTVSELNGMLNAKSAPDRVLYEAALKLGTMYLDHGQADKAVAAYQKASTFANSSFQKASAYYILGVADERATQFKAAIDAFQQGLSKNVDGLNGEILLGMVRNYLKLNDKQNAKLYFEKLNKDLPGAKATEMAQELLK
jgi:tetratricopeptide (TPR) repeat protein